MNTTPPCAPDSKARQGDQPDLERRRLLLPLSNRAQATDDEAAERIAPFLAVAEYIRQRSAAAELVDIRRFQEEPYSLDEESIALLLAQIGASETCADIVAIGNDEARYYYSERSMSDNYARLLLFAGERDICKAIADTVRFECQTYPRPYKARMLKLAPYSFDQEQIDDAIRLLERQDAFQDIRRVAASNGERYLFSERFMSYGKAKGLCEWIEVEQYENP